MRRARPGPHVASRGLVRVLRDLVVVPCLVLATAACGPPGDGSVRSVDPTEVPYRLLEDEPPPTSTPPPDGVSTRSPVAYWVAVDRLRPVAVESSCAAPAEEQVVAILAALAAGPSEELRSRGRSSALPTDLDVALAGIDDGAARVEVEATTVLGAEQLPVAVGQIVLSVTSAAGVDSVVLLQDGVQVQVPLPAGVLTSDPVTALDYADLVPRRLQAAGCPRP